MKLSILYTLAAIANTEEKKGKYAWEDKKGRSTIVPESDQVVH